MWNSIKSAAASAVVLAFVMPGLIAHARADSTSDGVVTVKSDYPVAETVSRIKRDVAKKGIMFFGVIDQAKLGNAAGNQVLPSRLVQPATRDNRLSSTRYPARSWKLVTPAATLRPV